MFQPDNEPLAAPDLNVMAVDHALRLGYGLAVVATNQRLKTYEMSVKANGVSPVLCHRYFKGCSSPASSLASSDDSNGSWLAQSRHWNLRPPVFHSKNCMDLRHFGQVGGGMFLGMAPHAGSGASTGLTVTD
jgi:hypothetical protein